MKIVQKILDSVKSGEDAKRITDWRYSGIEQ